MANQTVYPYGTEGSLPSSVGLINDLVTGGVDKALTAEQGAVVGEYLFDRDVPVDLSNVTVSNYGLGAGTLTNNKWTTNGKHMVVPVTPGDTLIVSVSSTEINGGWYAFFTSSYVVPTSTSQDPPYVSGTSRVWLETSAGEVTLTTPSGAAYICMCPRDGNSYNSTWTLKKRDFADIKDDFIEKSSIADNLTTSDPNSPLSANQGVVLKGMVDSGKYRYDEINLALYSGSLGNYINLTQNTWQSSSATQSFFVPIVPGKTYRVVANVGNPSRIAILKTNVDTIGTTPDYATGETALHYWSAGTLYEFTAPSDAHYISLNNTLSGDNICPSYLGVKVDRVEDLEERVSDLEGGVGGSDMTNVLRQARFVSSSPSAQSLALLHFSDIHGDTIAASYIKNFAEQYASYIDDLVQTGDAVYYYWNSDGQGYQWYQQDGIPEALFVLGNHDGCANDNSQGWKEGSADWDFKGKEWDFDTYFADYITSRGVTPPTGYDDPTSPYYKACYWHKDYASAKIRVIGLDCMHFNDGVRYTSNDQETWLAAKLQETLTSGNAAYGYSVIFLCHYPLDDFSGANETWNDTDHKFVFNQNANGGYVVDNNNQLMVKCHYGSSFSAEARFSMRNRVGTVGSPSYTKGNDNPIGDVIQSWMNNGGKYIAWLCGHTHTEYMYYPAKYPDMLVVGLPQAGNTRGTNQADRSDTSPMHSCANLCVIDTQNNLLKIIRVGKTLDKNLMEFKYLTYQYATKSVVRR